MGTGLLSDRLARELALLTSRFPRMEYTEEGHWFLLPEYLGPPGVWTKTSLDICFQVATAYPGQKPYAFYVRQPFGLAGGGAINNVVASDEPPFDGEWLKFSWDMPDWQASDDLGSGYNLLNWALSFRARLEEGA